MSTLLALSAVCLIVAALIELGARIYYRSRFLMPFHSRVIGEYPFADFLEKDLPPLHFRFKRGFRSPQININRFGLRGPEPARDGLKKRMLVLGESNYFGSKLTREEDLWSVQLQKLLQQQGVSQWEILNGGVPGYNAVQYRAWWEEDLVYAKPQILLLAMGLNDITQAYVMGSQWEPGAPWPWEFILRQQRKSPWWNKWMARFCAYFLWRRQRLTERKGFEAGDARFCQEKCVETVLCNARSIIRDARERGIKTALITFGFAYNTEMSIQDRRRADAIQSNWRESLESTGRLMIDFARRWVQEFAKEVGCPAIDVMTPFREHPRRLEMFLDMAHWNRAGHLFTAEILFREVDKLGWWGSEEDR